MPGAGNSSNLRVPDLEVVEESMHDGVSPIQMKESDIPKSQPIRPALQPNRQNVVYEQPKIASGTGGIQTFPANTIKSEDEDSFGEIEAEGHTKAKLNIN